MIGDVLTLELRGEAAHIQKSLDETNKQAKVLKQTLTEIEKTGGKGSDEWKKYKLELKETQEQAAKLSKELKLMDVSKMTIRQLEIAAKDLAKEMKNADRSSQEYVKNAKRLGEVEKELDKAAKQAKALKQEGEDLGKPTLWNKITTGVKGFGTAFQAVLALQIVQFLYNTGKAVFDATSKFEGYEKSLSATLQATMSATEAEKAAAQSMKALSQIAKETPLSLDDVTKAYIGLAGRGLRPGEEQMKRMIDVSTKARLPLDQLGEAIKDINNNERWTEFGIKVKTSGDKISTTIGNTTREFAKTEQGAMEMVVALGEVPGTLNFAAQQMDSLSGKSANVGDALEALQVTVGKKLTPIFLALLEGIATGIDWFISLANASDPVVKVFEDIYETVEDLFSSWGNAISSIIPDFVSGWISLDGVMKIVGLAFRAVLTPTQMVIGSFRLVFDAIAGVVEGGKALVKFFAGDYTGALESFEKSKKNFTNVGIHADETFSKIKKGWTDAFVDQPKKDSEKAQLVSYTAEELRQMSVASAAKVAAEKRAAEAEKESKKESAKRIKEQEKEQKERLAAEQKYDEQVAKDRAKALELVAQLESEHEATVTAHTLASEDAKINEKRRKRLKEINDSLADENTKESARIAINKSADAELEKAKTEFRAKELKAQQEADQKKIANTLFINEQERQAELVHLDWKQLQAKGNAKKLAEVAKERLDTEMRFLQEKLRQEEAAEKARISADFTDKDQAAAAILAVEARYHQESITATDKAAADKKKIDDDLRKKKEENLQGYSNMFASLLKGDINGFMAGASKMVQGHKAAWQEKLAADTANYEEAGQAAIAAVGFLNDLAQKRADKAIAEANRERDEKVAILENEMAVTDSLITSSSNYITALKAAETDRLTELQRILTDETSTEEQKRDALKRYYSEQLQQMKAAEESKIQDLQRLANLAKTDDEKRAIEAKIALAEKESAEKIRLAEEEYESKKTNIDELNQFTTEISNEALAEATAHSEKQIKITSDEAEAKADFKADLEDTIAAENRKARATEQAEKTKAFKAQKKADIATALITGALAVLKALANFFPLNIILAATAAVVTGVQIAKIKNQPDPVFALGGVPTLGHVPQGGKHGIEYGTGGIGLFDRATGRDVGEMEGGEAIISTKQTEANWPLIQQMFKNARTPGKANTPVIQHPGVPMAFRDGGKFESPYFERGMYLFGSKKRKAEQAARDAEAEAAAAQAEADAAMADMPSFDSGAYGGIDGNDPASMGDTAGAQAEHEAAKKQGAEQATNIKALLDETKANGARLDKVISITGELKGAVNGVENSVNSVRDAVYNTNTQGKFDELIGKISSMSA